MLHLEHADQGHEASRGTATIVVAVDVFSQDEQDEAAPMVEKTRLRQCSMSCLVDLTA